MIIELNVSSKTIRFLEKHTGINLCNVTSVRARVLVWHQNHDQKRINRVEFIKILNDYTTWKKTLLRK